MDTKKYSKQALGESTMERSMNSPLEAVGMTREEIEALPKRKTWYGIVGTSESSLVPWKLTDNADVAKASAVIANHDWPASGPWHVVTLTENLRTPA